jgi:hypothetical protein
MVCVQCMRYSQDVAAVLQVNPDTTNLQVPTSVL